MFRRTERNNACQDNRYPEGISKATTPKKELEYCKRKGKAVPLQAWSVPGFSRKLRFSVFMTTAQEDGKVVSLRHRPLLPPGNPHDTHFC